MLQWNHDPVELYRIMKRFLPGEGQVEVEDMREIRVEINATTGELCVWNDGPGPSESPFAHSLGPRGSIRVETRSSNRSSQCDTRSMTKGFVGQCAWRDPMSPFLDNEMRYADVLQPRHAFVVRAEIRVENRLGSRIRVWRYFARY